MSPTKRVVVETRRGLIAIVFVALITLPLGAAMITNSVSNNCKNINKLVLTLDAIIASGDKQTEQYVKEGLLTPAQAKRADRYREQQRKALHGAECQ